MHFSIPAIYMPTLKRHDKLAAALNVRLLHSLTNGSHTDMKLYSHIKRPTRMISRLVLYGISRQLGVTCRSFDNKIWLQFPDSKCIYTIRSEKSHENAAIHECRTSKVRKSETCNKYYQCGTTIVTISMNSLNHHILEVTNINWYLQREVSDGHKFVSDISSFS